MSSRPAERDSLIYWSSITSHVSARDVPLRTGWAYCTSPLFPVLSHALLTLISHLSHPISVWYGSWKGFFSPHCVLVLSRSIISGPFLFSSTSCLFPSLSHFLHVPLNPRKRLSVSPSPVSPRCPGEPVLSSVIIIAMTGPRQDESFGWHALGWADEWILKMERWEFGGKGCSFSLVEILYFTSEFMFVCLNMCQTYVELHPGDFWLFAPAYQHTTLKISRYNSRKIFIPPVKHLHRCSAWPLLESNRCR